MTVRTPQPRRLPRRRRSFQAEFLEMLIFYQSDAVDEQLEAIANGAEGDDDTPIPVDGICGLYSPSPQTPAEQRILVKAALDGKAEVGDKW